MTPDLPSTRTIPVPFHGRCACGAVLYECTAPPVRMVNCHCRDCQRASGSAYSPTLIMSAGSVRLLRGECKEYRTIAESGNVAKREFCGTCGTPLFAASLAGPGFLGVKAASLDDPTWFAPEADVWVDNPGRIGREACVRAALMHVSRDREIAHSPCQSIER